LPEDAAEERDCLSKLPASMLSFVGSDNEAYPNDDYPHRIGGPIKGPYHETAAFHVLDVGTNYFGLWTEADIFAANTRSTPIRSVLWNKD